MLERLHYSTKNDNCSNDMYCVLYIVSYVELNLHTKKHLQKQILETLLPNKLNLYTA
jgi:hypothetical protein